MTDLIDAPWYTMTEHGMAIITTQSRSDKALLAPARNLILRDPERSYIEDTSAGDTEISVLVGRICIE